jgi:uncharacterized membrane protein
MLRRIFAIIHRHRCYYIALICGVCAGFLAWQTSFQVRLAIAGDTFYVLYLVLIAWLVIPMPPDGFRDTADDEDEGLPAVTLITLSAIVINLYSIFSLLNAPHRESFIDLVLSLASAPLGWLALHTVFALHYAHVFYADRLSANKTDWPGDALEFPRTKNPGVWDFVYYSYVVGMTAQVSDVQVCSTAMRRLTTLHGIVSFVFNTVLIALTVNVAVALAQAR